MQKHLLVLIVAAVSLVGCRTESPPVHFAEKPRYQTNDRHPSNLFPSAKNHDSYMWYRGDRTRNVRLGENYIGSGTTGEGYYGGGKPGAHGGAGPPEAPGGGGYYGPPGYYAPSFRYPGVFY